MLDALGLRRIALVGHSLGSLFAGRFAAAYPDRVSALALLSPALGYRVPAGGPLPPNVQARIDGLERLGAAAYAARSAPRLVFRPETKPDLVARVEAAMAAVGLGGYAQAVRALGAGDLIGDAAAIAAPTLVAVGAQDVVTPPENAQRLRDALRRAEPLSIVADSGHALPQEAPALAADLLSTFIRTSPNV
jgi:pimeloyl-ACP methyl ester carboxylesterase